jgi:hypothetical protein
VIAALVGLVLPAAAVWLALSALRRRSLGEPFLLTAALSFSVALALSSATTYWFVALSGGLAPWHAPADALLWTSIGAVSWWTLRRGRTPPAHEAGPSSPPPPFTLSDWVARAAFGVVAAVALATVITEYQAAPHGQWDAWAIWNQKARFFFRSGGEWNRFFAIPWSNPGHPILVSLSVARLWTYAGAELTVVPALLAGAIGAAIVAGIIGALDPRRARAWIAGAVVLAPGDFPYLVAAQTADLALALFVVATFIAMRRAWTTNTSGDRMGRAQLGVAGVTAAAAVWTKNEGLVFIAAATVVVAWTTRRQARQAAWWAMGAAPVLATALWFKLGVAPAIPPEYLPQGQTTSGLFARLLSIDRHAFVASLVAPYGLRWGGPAAAGSLPIVLVAAAFAAAVRSRLSRTVMVAAAVMCASYYAVWVLSPLDTVWLVATTFDRLLMQLWPSLVLAAFTWDEGGSRPGQAEPFSPTLR